MDTVFYAVAVLVVEVLLVVFASIHWRADKIEGVINSIIHVCGWSTVALVIFAAIIGWGDGPLRNAQIVGTTLWIVLGNIALWILGVSIGASRLKTRPHH